MADAQDSCSVRSMDVLAAATHAPTVVLKAFRARGVPRPRVHRCKVYPDRYTAGRAGGWGVGLGAGSRPGADGGPRTGDGRRYIFPQKSKLLQSAIAPAPQTRGGKYSHGESIEDRQPSGHSRIKHGTMPYDTNQLGPPTQASDSAVTRMRVLRNERFFLVLNLRWGRRAGQWWRRGDPGQ